MKVTNKKQFIKTYLNLLTKNTKNCEPKFKTFYYTNFFIKEFYRLFKKPKEKRKQYFELFQYKKL